MVNHNDFPRNGETSEASISLMLRVWRAGEEIVGLASRNPEGIGVVTAVDFQEVPLPEGATTLPFVLSKALKAGYEVEATTTDGTKVLIKGISTSGDSGTKDDTGGDPSGDREPRNPLIPQSAGAIEIDLDREVVPAP